MKRAVRVGSFVLLAIALFLTVWLLFFSERSSPLSPTPVSSVSPVTQVDPPVFLPSVDPPPDNVAPEISHPKSGRYVAAWMPTDWDTDNARASFEANLDYIEWAAARGIDLLDKAPANMKSIYMVGEIARELYRQGSL